MGGVLEATRTQETLVLITGATSGLGAGLARTVPWPNCRVINLSRSLHPDCENIYVDLTDPASWSDAARSIAQTVSGFTGERIILVHNAYHAEPVGFIGEVDRDALQAHILANAAAPLVLGDAFVRAVAACDGIETGLVLISSAGARIPFEGNAVYCASKAAIEQWTRVVRAERRRRGAGPWTIAIRPGTVDTPQLHAAANEDPRNLPHAPMIRDAIASGAFESPDQVAAKIWAELPPASDGRHVIFLGEVPEGVTELSQ